MTPSPPISDVTTSTKNAAHLNWEVMRALIWFIPSAAARVPRFSGLTWRGLGAEGDLLLLPDIVASWGVVGVKLLGEMSSGEILG